MRNLKSKKELVDKGIDFQLIPLIHQVHSVRDVQIACKCEASEVIKTMVFIGDNPIIIILPGDKKADINKIKALIGVQDLRMAKPEEISNLTGYDVGSISPFGINSIIKQIADNSILSLTSLILGSGQGDILIMISQVEFRKSFRGTFASITN